MKQSQWGRYSYCLLAWRTRLHSMKAVTAQTQQSEALLQVEPAVKRAPLEERKKRKRDDAEGSTQAAAPEGSAQTAAPEREARAAAPAAATPPAQRPQRVRTRVPGAAAAKQQLLRTVAVGGLDASSMAAAIAMARAAGKVSLLVSSSCVSPSGWPFEPPAAALWTAMSCACCSCTWSQRKP